jgi:hypothetical protein
VTASERLWVLVVTRGIHFGIKPDPLIRDAGLDPSLFDDGTNVVAFTTLARLYTAGQLGIRVLK